MDMKNKMPATKVLLIFFCLMIALSFYFGFYTAMTGGWSARALFSGALIIFLGLLLSFLVRMIANVGQILFDIKAHLMNVYVEQKVTTEVLSSDIEKINQELKQLSTNSVQINCDTKELNQNIHQLRDFFSRIEKHLKLEK